MYWPYINKEILQNKRVFKLFLSGMRSRVFRTADDCEIDKTSDKPKFYGESMDFQDAITAVNRQIKNQTKDSYMDHSGMVEYKYKFEVCLGYGTFIFEPTEDNKIRGYLNTESETMKDMDFTGETFQEVLENLFKKAQTKIS